MSLHVIFNVSCAEVGANKPAQVYVTPLPYRSGSLLRVFLYRVLPPASPSVLSSSNINSGLEFYLLLAPGCLIFRPAF